MSAMLSPVAVGERMLRIMERTLTLPFRLIRPFRSGEEEEAIESP